MNHATGETTSTTRLAFQATIHCLTFWGSLALALALGFVAAFPVNRWLVGRGLGHAVVHGAHS